MARFGVIRAPTGLPRLHRKIVMGRTKGWRMSAKGVHTSGPWKVYHAKLRSQLRGSPKIIEIQSDHGAPIVQWSGFDNSERLKKTHLANARLMAAAPDMLDVLRNIDAMFSRLQLTLEETAVFEALDAVIRKAEGRR